MIPTGTKDILIIGKSSTCKLLQTLILPDIDGQFFRWDNSNHRADEHMFVESCLWVCGLTFRPPCHLILITKRHGFCTVSLRDRQGMGMGQSHIDITITIGIITYGNVL